MTQLPEPTSTDKSDEAFPPNTPMFTFTADSITGGALLDILSERHRQIFDEGYTAEVDDLGQAGRLAAASASYLLHASIELACKSLPVGTPASWPFDSEYWKPKSAKDNLVRALALGLAELEKYYREEARQVKEELEKKFPPTVRDPEEYL